MSKHARRPALKPIVTVAALLACIALALLAGTIVRHTYTVPTAVEAGAGTLGRDAATDGRVE